MILSLLVLVHVNLTGLNMDTQIKMHNFYIQSIVNESEVEVCKIDGRSFSFKSTIKAFSVVEQ
jgi:hypothetical protein